MYINFYGFSENPFSLLPDSDFLFLSPQHEHALNLLQLAIINRSGFSAISGPPGTGKTTLIRALLARLDNSVSTGLITDTYAGFSELLERILSAYELECPEKDDVSRYKRFTDFVIQEYATNRNVLLIVDEAQNLSPGAMEQLRMLSNINADKHTMIQIMLIGQESLQDKLRSPYLKQLAQRIEANHQLEPLDARDTCAYIQHRISKAGGPAGLFEDSACKLIHQKSGGIPRVINRICDMSLVYAYAADMREIDAEIVLAASEEQLASTPVPSAETEPLADYTSAVSQHPDARPTPVRAEAPTHDSADDNNASIDELVGVTDETDASYKVAAKCNAVANAAEQKAAALTLLTEKTEAAESAGQQAESLSTAAQRAELKNAAITEELAKCVEHCKHANRQLEAEQLRVKQLVDEEQAAQQAATTLEEAAREAKRRANEEEIILTQQLEAMQLAEQQAIENAAVATEAAEQALRERIAAEKAAADIADKAETSVNQACEELIKTESRVVKQLDALNVTAELADTDQQLALKAAQRKADELESARTSAALTEQETQQLASARDEVASNAEQQALIAREMCEQAEQAADEARQASAAQQDAEQDAAKLATAEKLLAAELADNLAQLARQEADQAEASKAAALRKAQEKEALAHAAAEQAIQAKADADKAAIAEMRMLFDEDDTPPAPVVDPQISHEELTTATRLAGQARGRLKRKNTWSLLAASSAGIALMGWVVMETKQSATSETAAISAKAETAALEIHHADTKKDPEIDSYSATDNKPGDPPVTGSTEPGPTDGS